MLRIPIDRIIVSKDNPRQSFDEEGLRRLGESIKTHGQLQSIIVRPRGSGYELVVGERRFRASKLIGLKEIEATVQALDDATCMEFRLIENTQREDLTEAEKGNAIATLLQQYPEKYPTIGALAKQLHKTDTTINRWFQQSERLSKLAKKSIQLKRISATVVRGLVVLSHEEQDKIIEAIQTYKIPITHEDKQTEFLNHYRLNPEKYPTVESLEELANEVKGVRKVKINLEKLSPKARAEVERKLKEAKKEAQQLRERPHQPRTNRRSQGRPKKKKVKPEPEPTSPNPIVPKEVKEIPVGSLWLEIPLYEKLFQFSADKNIALPEAVLFIVKQFFGEAT